jgi:hypothetical protein
MDDTLHQKSGDFYMDVREFKGGSIEVVVKAIRPMHEGAILSAADPDSYANYLKSIGMGYFDVHGSGLKRVVDENHHESQARKAENHKRAVRRAKQNIRWLIKEIEADRLLTLTYRKNQEDRQEVMADFSRFLRLVRNGWKGQQGQKDWQYVAVLERQERGAYHIHCAVKGWQRISFLRAAWFKALGGQGNETGEGTPGNIDVTSPQKARWGTQKREWKSSKLAGYLTKYLSKTFDEDTSEKRRYWHSKDSKAPKKERFILCATTMLQAIHEVVSIVGLHYGHAIDFSRSWVSHLGDSLWLSLGEAA